MPSLTDGQIRNAIKRVEKTKKQETLTDGEGRGVGRLVLIIKPMPTRTVSNWYAQQWINNTRRLSKIGDYPHMTLSEAREIFTRDYAAAINKGTSIKVQGDTRPGTLLDLFEAYCDHLEQNNKPSHKDVKAALNRIVPKLGPNRLARDVEPEDVLNVLRPIYERGKIGMADHMRGYIRSAFAWGMRSEMDYRNTSPRRFKLIHNPADAIPVEPRKAGTRWLNEVEWVQVWQWCEQPDMRLHKAYLRAIQLLLLTGQRVEEVCHLRAEQYNSEEKLLTWTTTKNGRPHTIPLPPLAVDLIESIKPNKYGLLFPSMKYPSKPLTYRNMLSFLGRAQERGVIPLFTTRDIRRTFKTLAGKAGITKVDRDRLQNHSLNDVSSKHYDYHEYLDEKAAAMQIWNNYVLDMLKQHSTNIQDLKVAA